MSKSCCDVGGALAPPEGEILVALAGNPNVGKSSLFNALTGLGVATAHYPGTTREIATGSAQAGERTLGVIDLPGTYGLSGSGEDEQVARRALLELKPDVVVVVIDPTTLARNLSLALEVIDLGLRVVLALNLADEARRAGIGVEAEALACALDVTVVTTVATRGVGLEELVDAAFVAASGPLPSPVAYEPDFEALIEPLVSACGRAVEGHETSRCRALALQLVEGRQDPDHPVPGRLQRQAEEVRSAIRVHFDEDPGVHLARERNVAASALATSVLQRVDKRRWFPRDLWSLTTSPWTGIPLVAVVAASVFGFLFFVGNLLASAFSSAWGAYASPFIQELVHSLVGRGLGAKILLWGVDDGVGAALGVGLPYILTFYILLGLLEDSGYLNSLAFLTDRVMHRLGMHGRAIVPLIAAAGCNVPALMAAGQLPTKRERQIASTLVLFIPCSARTAVIMGSVGAFIGWQAAAMVLAIVFVLWFGIALVLERLLPGESQGLVMEMFGFRRPSIRRVVQKSWLQFREFLLVATPIVVVGSLVLGGLYESGWLFTVSKPLSPFIVGWLGLPLVAGVTLIVGALRAELSLQLLIALAAATTGHATGIRELMNPVQLVVFALVNTIALPCISSVAVYWRRQGLKATIAVVAGSLVGAALIAGIVGRVLTLVGFGG